MRLFQRLFYQPKHKEKTTGEQSIYRILAPSVLAIFLCTVCLCGASWAWFTASTSTGITTIQSSSYKLVYQVGEDAEPTELAEADNIYTMTSDTAEIILKATGTAGATGYCSIAVGEETYYTEQIFTDGTFTFTVNAATGTTIAFTPKWGTYSGTATIQDKGEITTTGSQPSNTQAPDNTVTTEPSAEPTAPITPTTPSSTPAENKTTTPEPSATASTEPETTDTEPTPAPEDTTPAASEPTDTTSDQTE